MAETIEVDGQQVPVERLAPSSYAGEDRRDIGRLARSESGREAAAVATANIMASFLGDPSSPRVAENAGAVLDEIRDDLVSRQEIEQPAPAAAPAVARTQSGLHVVEQPPEEMPTDYELPPEYAFLNEEETVVDDLDLAPEEPVAVEPEGELEFPLDEDDLADPRIAALAAENEKLRKKAAHEAQLRVKTSRPTWEQEAKKVFRLGDVPLLDDDDLASIKAESKREFLRQAKQIADRNKRVIIRVAPTQRSEAEIVRETKAELWGKPPASAPPSDVEDVDGQRRLAAARRTGNLGKIFGEMIRSGS